MITLYKFPPAWSLPTPSSFALKVETYMRMADIPYEIEHVSRPQNSPKGTIPYIDHDGELLADSGFILEHLKTKFGDHLNEGLSENDKAVAHMARRMFEENLARIIGCSRWMIDENWPQTVAVGFAQVPDAMRDKVSAAAREKITEDMHIHGIGRHSAEEIQDIGIRDVKAAETLLGAKPYMMGEAPTELDATAFGTLAQYIVPPLKCGISDYARASDTLSAYVTRMLDRYFPDQKSGGK